MRAGKLNKRITIQQAGTTQDANGEIIEAWSTFAAVWAGIQDITGREYLAAAATQNATTSKITIRHLDGVLPAMRVMHGADIFNIEAVLGQDGRQLLLMCSRGVGDG